MPFHRGEKICSSSVIYFILKCFSAFSSSCLYSSSWYSRDCSCTDARRIQGQVWSNQATVGCARAGVSLPDGQARGNGHKQGLRTWIREVNKLLVTIHYIGHTHTCTYIQPVLFLNRQPKSTTCVHLRTILCTLFTHRNIAFKRWLYMYHFFLLLSLCFLFQCT